MKIIKCLCALILMVIFVGNLFADLQKTDLKSWYDKEMLKTLLESISVEKFVRQDRHYGSDRLYLIGISPKGKLAFLSYETNPQYIQWNFAIVDLVYDEVVCKRSGEPHDEVVSPTVFFTPDSLLTDLREHEIYISDGPIAIQAFPLEKNNDVYSTEVSEKKKLEDDWSPDTRFDVILHSRNKGSKILTEIACSSHPEPYVEGYLLSPYEERIAVVVRFDLAFIEGEFAGSFAIAGGHLNFGFKK